MSIRKSDDAIEAELTLLRALNIFSAHSPC